MPWSYETSVVTRGGKDYWRTWFIDECEQHGMFGLTEKHLPLVMTDGQGFQAYREGTEIYLEDAPYFKKNKDTSPCLWTLCGNSITSSSTR